MSELGDGSGPRLITPVPGPRSVAAVDVLARGECAAITARRARRAVESGVAQDPIVWARGRGAEIEDVDGNVYVDLTAAFAVAGLGHAHPEVVRAGQRQLARLPHAMGDVYPSDAKIELLEALGRVAPPGLGRAILGLSGSSAIEAALKTAAIATGRPGVLAFWGAYHGLGHGALAATGYRRAFREPFLSQLNPWARHVPFPDACDPPFGIERGVSAAKIGRAVLAHIDRMLAHPASGAEMIGAILIEPIQGRGGYLEAPPGFLAGLRRIADERRVLLIYDEIYTGFGRTGEMFACEREPGALPDLLCVGKAMGAGAPIAAVLGTDEVMGAWGSSGGESIHTSTFLGNPVGCAMARASIEVLVRDQWPKRVAALGKVARCKFMQLQEQFPDRVGSIRGRGLMLGLPIESGPSGRPDAAGALRLVDFCRQRGYLILPSGIQGNVLAFSPPFVLQEEQIDGFVRVLSQGLRAIASRS